MVLICAIGSLWQFVVRPRIKSLCEGRFHSGRCVERDCGESDSCGHEKGALYYCNYVRPGMDWNAVKFRLGEPLGTTSLGYYYGVEFKLEVRVTHGRAVAFRVGAMPFGSDSGMVWRSWQDDVTRTVDCEDWRPWSGHPLID